MPKNTSRCDRIIALVDRCLDEIAVITDDQEEPSAPVPVGSAHEGGAVS